MSEPKKMRSPDPAHGIGPDQRAGLITMLDFLSYDDPFLHTKTMLEVGTYFGESAAIFARFFREVYTCDPWCLDFLRTVACKPDLTEQDAQSFLAANISGLENVHFLRLPSALAARSFSDQSLDLVYIDGWHRVMPCIVDLLSWLPKLKPGGWIGGHDYTTGAYSEVIPAVRYVLGEPDHVFSDSSWLKRVPDLHLLPNRPISL